MVLVFVDFSLVFWFSYGTTSREQRAGFCFATLGSFFSNRLVGSLLLGCPFFFFFFCSLR